MSLELVVASSNRAKAAEVAEIMRGLPFRILTRDDFDDWPEVEETGETYLANALLKARALCAFTGRAALADDSGLEVDALDGLPGPRSARFAGPAATDEDNNRRLVSMLEGVPPERRTGRYRCVVALVFPDGAEVAAVGSCDGAIGLEPRGSGGFGYDPWFVPRGETRTMAEMVPREKHAISHRGKALRGLADKLWRQQPLDAGGPWPG